MTSEELIVRISKEMYDLKSTLQLIRRIAEEGFDQSKKEDVPTELRMYFIDIINEVDTGEIYE